MVSRLVIESNTRFELGSRLLTDSSFFGNRQEGLKQPNIINPCCFF